MEPPSKKVKREEPEESGVELNVQSNEPALSVGRVSSGDQRKRKTPKNAAKAIIPKPTSTKRRSAIKRGSIQVKLNDLPELPFEKILGYLPLQDLLRSRAVSRRWYKVISSFRPKCLAYSRCPKRFMYDKNRIVSGAFVQNFICSLRYESFFGSFSQSILSNLKQLLLFVFDPNKQNAKVFSQTFSQIVNSFGQLEELGLFYFNHPDPKSLPTIEFELNLPMLKSLRLDTLYGIKRMTLDAPKLENVKVWWGCDLKLVIVRGELVERLAADQIDKINVSELKSLKYLYLDTDESDTDFTFLSSLEQLKEIHLVGAKDVRKVFEQKRRYDRSNLKIFLSGVHLDGPDDPAIESISDFGSREYMRYLADHPSKVAHEIPLRYTLQYSVIECLDPLEIGVLNRFTDWTFIEVPEPVQDIDRFLGLLKSWDNVVGLDFQCDQPQELYDRLLDHCDVQWLWIRSQLLQDLNFLFRLKSLIDLSFEFQCGGKTITVEVGVSHSKQYQAAVRKGERKRKRGRTPNPTTCFDLDAAIKFVIKKLADFKKKSSSPF